MKYSHLKNEAKRAKVLGKGISGKAANLLMEGKFVSTKLLKECMCNMPEEGEETVEVLPVGGVDLPVMPGVIDVEGEEEEYDSNQMDGDERDVKVVLNFEEYNKVQENAIKDTAEEMEEMEDEEDEEDEDEDEDEEESTEMTSEGKDYNKSLRRTLNRKNRLKRFVNENMKAMDQNLSDDTMERGSATKDSRNRKSMSPEKTLSYDINKVEGSMKPEKQKTDNTTSKSKGNVLSFDEFNKTADELKVGKAKPSEKTSRQEKVKKGMGRAPKHFSNKEYGNVYPGKTNKRGSKGKKTKGTYNKMKRQAGGYGGVFDGSGSTETTGEGGDGGE